MKIIYLITKIITYPGAFMKGFWEHITCRILKLEVTDRHYLSADWHCGHARHIPAMSPAKALLLAWLPYIAQRILAWIFLAASVPPLLIFGHRSSSETSFFWLEVIALFLGVSLFCNSFPQRDDAKRLWRLFYGAPTEEEAAALAQLQAQEQAAIEAAAEERSTEDEPCEEAAEEAIAEEACADTAPEEEACTEEVIEEAVEEEPTEEEVVAEEAAEEEAAEEEAAEEEAAEEIPELPQGLPKFAKLPAKIIFAPANLYFVVGAWCERSGIPLALAIAGIVAAFVLG